MDRFGPRTLADVTADRPDDRDGRLRALLASIIGGVRDGRPVADLLAPGVDAGRVAELVAPIGRADGEIESIAVNGERVDAVVNADDAQWRVVFGAGAAGLIEWLDVYERPARFDGLPGGLVIVVNGPSGAGKSTLMRALQGSAIFPLVVLDEPEHIGTVQPGYLIWRDRAPALHRGYLAAAAALAREGNHVAVAAAGHALREFVDALGNVPLIAVGMTCDVEVLVERERRTGRWAGIAIASLGVHDGWTYDLQFDTTTGPDPDDLARQVLARAGL